jgi:activator of HSP90 ATPase
MKSSDGAAASTGSGNSSINSSASASPAASPATAAPKSKIKVASFKSRIQFSAPPQLVFETLLDAPRVSAFTQSPAEISATKGSSFKLFNGTITGEITDLEPGKKLSQKWRSKDWPEDHFSQVTMAFEQHDGANCVITLSHSNVPDSDFERTRAGWEQFFWQRIRGVFGWQYSVSNL